VKPEPERTDEEAEALRELMAVWDQVYNAALEQFDGDTARAEACARAYMSGWLRRTGEEGDAS
jgi:hypothetical protein